MSLCLVSLVNSVAGPGGEFYDAIFGHVSMIYPTGPEGPAEGLLIYAVAPTDDNDEPPVFSVPMHNVAAVWHTEYVAVPVSDDEPLVYDCTAVGLDEIVPEDVDDAVILPLIAAQAAVNPSPAEPTIG